MSSAVLLIAHGSRRREANDDLVRLAKSLQSRWTHGPVEIAYLELAEPTIPQGLEACLRQGATEIRMSPYFLSEGAHVTEDLAGFRDEFTGAHPDVRVVLCPPLGLHPLIVEIVLQRIGETA
jgi:sirohydrochlorin ferrochelatase